MHLTIFPGNTGEFKKIAIFFFKMQHFKNAQKIHHKQKINYMVFFKSDSLVCNHLNVNFVKTTLKTIYLKKKSIFAFLTQKEFLSKRNCSKTQLIVCSLKCTYKGKQSFNFICVWSEIMNLKSDQLELGFSISCVLRMSGIK